MSTTTAAPTPAPTPASAATPETKNEEKPVHLPSTADVKSELTSAPSRMKAKIFTYIPFALGGVTAISLLALLSFVVALAIGAATLGVGIGVAAILIVLAASLIAGVGTDLAYTHSDKLFERMIPKELDLLKHPVNPEEPFKDRCNSFMSRYPRDPGKTRTKIPDKTKDSFVNVQRKFDSLTAEDPREIEKLVRQKKHGEACDFLWGVYSREEKLQEKVELALSIAALTKKTKSQLSRSRRAYFDANRQAVEELLLKTYRDVEGATEKQMTKEDKQAALDALSKMRRLMQEV
jgi:hypothetical protein